MKKQMKKKYVSPVMECEEFVANEYVAACTTYSFYCQTPNNNTYYYLVDDTTNDYTRNTGDKYIISNRSFTGCNELHDNVEFSVMQFGFIANRKLYQGGDWDFHIADWDTEEQVYWCKGGLTDNENAYHFINLKSPDSYRVNAS